MSQKFTTLQVICYTIRQHTVITLILLPIDDIRNVGMSGLTECSQARISREIQGFEEISLIDRNKSLADQLSYLSAWIPSEHL
jgi:hypothetical protein